jgi:protein phosphatase-4 regulatory subunit 3
MLQTFLENNALLVMIGILEYAPTGRVYHRTYLTETVTFKQAFPIEDASLLNLIHDSFRLQYLRDVVLAGWLDDLLLNILTSIIIFHNVDILERIQSDEEFIGNLFRILCDSEDDDTISRRDQVKFLYEFCKLANSLELSKRRDFNTALIDRGVLLIFDYVLSHHDADVRTTGAVILFSLLELNSQQVQAKTFAQIAAKAMRPSLLMVLTDAFIEDSQPAVLVQLMESLKILIDVESNFFAAERKKIYVRHFLDDGLSSLIETARSSTAATLATHVNVVRVELILDLISHCIARTGFTVYLRSFFKHTEALSHLVILFDLGNSVISLAMLRLLRALLTFRLHFLMQRLISLGYVAKVISLLRLNGPRFNLTTSAVLELLTYLSKEGTKVVLAHMVETYGDELKAMTISSAGRDLCKALESGGAGAGASQQPTQSLEAADDDLLVDMESSSQLAEEAYFDSVDEDDEAAAPMQVTLQDEEVLANRPKRRQVDDDDDEDDVLGKMMKEARK